MIAATGFNVPLHRSMELIWLPEFLHACTNAHPAAWEAYEEVVPLSNEPQRTAFKHAVSNVRDLPHPLVVEAATIIQAIDREEESLVAGDAEYQELHRLVHRSDSLWG